MAKPVDIKKTEELRVIVQAVLGGEPPCTNDERKLALAEIKRRYFETVDKKLRYQPRNYLSRVMRILEETKRSFKSKEG